MSFRLGIRGKMIAMIALPTLAIYLGVLGLTLWQLVTLRRAELEREMTARAANDAARFDAAFDKVATVARTTASMLESAPDLTEQQVRDQLRANVLLDDAIYGAATAFEPGSFKSGDELFAPYAHRSKGGVVQMNIDRSVYDWYADPQWQWWHLPKQSGEAVWTDPYFDRGAGEVLMVTFAAPFRRDGKFRGVTTADVEIARIRDRVGTAIVGRELDFIILTREGQFVYDADPSHVMSGQTAFDLMSKAGRNDIADVCRAVIAGGRGRAEIRAWPGTPPAGMERWAKRSWLFFAPIRSTGWTFCAIVPEDVAFAGMNANMTQAAFALGVTLLLIVACIFVVGNVITRPIARLAHVVRAMASGDLDQRVEVTGRDEIGSLAHDVNHMAAELKEHVERVSQERAQSREAVIFAMAKLAESRDDDTGTHLERICKYVEVLAAAVARRNPELDGDWVRTVSVTAALHDIGKVGIPDAVLKKAGRLTDDERRKMQSHTTIGGDTLIALRREWTHDDFLRIAAEIALAHHERWDGTGYPFGLAGNDISLAARIVSVADVYDALTSKRVYKDAMSHDAAVKLIVEGSGRQFDPRIVEAMLSVGDRFRAISAAANGRSATPPPSA